MEQDQIIIDKNLAKKKEIDDVMAKYRARMAMVKKERDGVLSNFLKTLQEKRLEELRITLRLINKIDE